MALSRQYSYFIDLISHSLLKMSECLAKNSHCRVKHLDWGNASWIFNDWITFDIASYRYNRRLWKSVSDSVGSYRINSFPKCCSINHVTCSANVLESLMIGPFKSYQFRILCHIIDSGNSLEGSINSLIVISLWIAMVMLNVFSSTLAPSNLTIIRLRPICSVFCVKFLLI